MLDCSDPNCPVHHGGGAPYCAETVETVEYVAVRDDPLCPLLRQKCVRERCAWFITFKEYNECAITVLAVNLSDLLPF
jgi:hypothetical protein